MKDYLKHIQDWKKNGNKMVLARVIKTWGSSPRPIGSVMIVNQDGKMAGSVSGGCVEGAVVKKSLDVLDGQKSLKLSYGVSDEDAWSVGLSCGGSIQVYLETMDFDESKVWNKLLQNIEENKSSILVSSLKDGGNEVTLINEDESAIGDAISEEVKAKAKEAYDLRSSRTIESEGQEYFVQIFPRKPILLIIGVAHITVDLVSLGNRFGFETVVIDPRGFFANNTSFKEEPSQRFEAYPSEVLNKFPLDSYTFAAILSHDPKIDDNALEILLKKDLGYIGALGSKKTHAKRSARLTEKGFTEEEIAKIQAPIGVSINARSAEEIALAIMAQIIEFKNANLVR